MPVGSSPKWTGTFEFLEWYADNSISDRIRIFKGHEGWYVSVRLIAFCGMGLLAYQWPAVSRVTMSATLCFLADALFIVTSHAFGLASPPPSNALRFVLLNLAAFLSLTPAFAILLAPAASRFEPTLNWQRAIEVAFVATTGSNALAPSQSHWWLSSLIIGTSTVLGLYYVFVVLVVAVGHAQRTTASKQ